jgi:hypothetical protein
VTLSFLFELSGDSRGYMDLEIADVDIKMRLAPRPEDRGTFGKPRTLQVADAAYWRVNW